MSYPQLYGNYVLLERLGMGGMSEVDLARQRMVDEDFVRFVVIKRIKTDRTADQSFIRMFKDEARITSELHHANIGAVYDFGREGDEYYLALEYVPGTDVRFIINALRERNQRVPVRIALRIIADVLDALDYAHSRKDGRGEPMRIVHRDVNPRNIMVSMHGETKLIDFGVAKAAGRLERTKTDHVKGKFSYMAPEQIKAEFVDGRADLFAVGLTLHEFLAGYSPFHGLNQVQIVHRLLQGRIPGIPEVKGSEASPELKRLHDRSLAVDPADRYPDAASMRADLMLAAKAAGGLPSRAQLARFLVKVDPRLTERLTEKMDKYSGDLPEMRSVSAAAVPVVSREDVSGTMEGVPVETGSDVTYTQTVSRTAVVGGGIAAGMMGMVVTAIVLVFVLLLLMWANLTAGPTGPTTPVEPTVRVQPLPSAPEPAPVVPSPVPVEPAPVEPVAPEPVEAPAPAVVPDPAPVTRPEPAAPDPRPVPEPVVPDPEPEVPEPVPEPEPDVPEPDPEPVVPIPEPIVPDPVPDPEPMAPDPVSLGTLMVNAPRSGTVYIDGRRRGTTPLRIELPAGTYQIRVEGYEPRTERVSPRQVNPVLFQ